MKKKTHENGISIALNGRDVRVSSGTTLICPCHLIKFYTPTQYGCMRVCHGHESRTYQQSQFPPCSMSHFLKIQERIFVGATMHQNYQNITPAFTKINDFGFPIVNLPWLSGVFPRIQSTVSTFHSWFGLSCARRITAHGALLHRHHKNLDILHANFRWTPIRTFGTLKWFKKWEIHQHAYCAPSTCKMG